MNRRKHNTRSLKEREAQSREEHLLWKLRDDIFAEDGRVCFSGVVMAFSVSCWSMPTQVWFSGGFVAIAIYGRWSIVSQVRTRRVIGWILWYVSDTILFGHVARHNKPMYPHMSPYARSRDRVTEN